MRCCPSRKPLASCRRSSTGSIGCRDLPVALRRFLKQTEVTCRAQPTTNGLAQGALLLFACGGVGGGA